jgi:hypothetical protein
MNELDAPIRRELDRWRVHAAERDWDDVVRRARRTGRARRFAKPALAVGGTALVVLAAAPALGLWSPQAERLPRPLFAEARGAAGTAVLEASTPNTFFVQRGPRNRYVAFAQTRSGGGMLLRPGATLSWTLRYDGEASIDEATLRAGVRRIRLCSPCGAESSGTTALTGAAAGAVFNGRGAVIVRTDRGTLTARIRFDPGGALPRPRRP